MGALEEAADLVLAGRAADGDEVAFAVIVRRHAPFLRAFATQLTRDPAEADDAVQDALITAWDRLPQLHDRSALRSWLGTIVARKAVDRMRSRRPAESLAEIDPPSLAPGPEESAELSAQLAALGRALQALPDDLRVTWVLREVSGESYDEIAERLEIPVSTVRGRLARARAGLLELMVERSPS